MKEKVQERKVNDVDKILNDVESARDDTRMFSAVKYLYMKPFENPYVNEKDGNNVTNKQSMYRIINQHFKEHFQKKDTMKVDQFAILLHKWK